MTTAIKPRLTMPRLVLRPIPGDRLYQAGEIVETANWPNTRNLEGERYIRELPYGSELHGCACGRIWADAGMAERCTHGETVGVSTAPASESDEEE